MAAGDVTLYDAQTGAPIQADAAAAGDLVRSGAAGFLPDQKVDIFDQAGKLQTLSGADAAAYLQSAEAKFGGGGVADAGKARGIRLQDEFGGIGGQLGAAGLGALDFASAGLAPAALIKAGVLDRRTVAGVEEANPFANMAGQGVGLAALALASGGSGAAARGTLGTAGRVGLGALEAATAPARAIGAVGRGVEGLIASGIGEGAGARLLASGASAATEGALFGVGNAIKTAAVEDHQLTAEKLVAAAGHGALLGGAAGAGLSAVGSVLRAGAGKVAEAGGALANRIAGGEAKLAGELAAAAPKTEATIKTLASRLETEFAIKSTGANAPMIGKLQAAGKDVEARVVRMVMEDLAPAINKEAGALLSAEEKVAAAKVLREAKGSEVGKMVDDLQAAGVKGDVRKFADEERARVVEKLKDRVNPDVDAAVKKMDDWYSGLKERTDGSPKQLWQTKHDLGESINWKNADRSDIYNELKKDLYFGLDREIQRLGAESGEKMGAEFAARWVNTNAEYRAADWLNKATGKGIERSTSNRNFGLSEQLGTVAGAVLGGGGLGGMAIGAAGAVANRLVKSYGADVGAKLARAASRGELASTVSSAFDNAASGKVASLVGVAKGALSEVRPLAPGVQLAEKAAKAANPRADFETRSKALAEFHAAPGPRLAAATAGLDGGRPELKQAVAATVQRGADFLTSKLPRRPEPPAGLPPHLAAKTQPSPDEVSRFLRYAKAVDDPLTVLDDAKKGKLSREAVEAVKAVYPSVYAALQSQVGEAMLARKKAPSWSERVQLATLLGLPTDANLEPDSIRLFQKLQQQAPAPNAPPAPQPAPKPLAAPMRPPALSTKSDAFGASA